jgi:hypothetical protein
MIKKSTFLMLVIQIIALAACQKEDSFESTKNEVSVYNDEYGKYRKEIVVYDETKQNSLFLLIHSDYPGAVEEYLDAHTLTLGSDIREADTNYSTTINTETEIENGAITIEIPEESIERQVYVELITENIQEPSSYFYLNVEYKKNELKSTNFIFGESTTYTTTGDFLGVVHAGYWNDDSGDEYDMYVYLEKKDYWYSLSYDAVSLLSH